MNRGTSAKTFKAVPKRKASTLRVSGKRGLQMLAEIYQGISGYTVNTFGMTNHATTYGEVSTAGIQSLSDTFRKLSPLLKFPVSQRIFYDLGSGIGSLVVGIAILNPEIQSRGIEIVPDRVRQAQTALAKIKSPKLLDRIKIHQGDIFTGDYNYRDAAWIFVSNLCFTPEMDKLLAEKLAKECLVGCTLICSRQVDIQGFKCIEKSLAVPMTWSTTSTCNVYKKMVS